MKKLSLYIFLVLMVCSNSFAEKTKLICKSLLEEVTGNVYNINFDTKTIDVFQGSGGNKLTFEVDRYDDHFIVSHMRILSDHWKGYDTYVTDWNEWASPEWKSHLWQIQINRIEGVVFITRSKKPYKEEKKTYKLVNLHEGLGGLKCKKSGVSTKF